MKDIAIKAAKEAGYTIGYDDWVVAEEESDFARQDGISAIKRNRDYLRLLGY